MMELSKNVAESKAKFLMVITQKFFLEVAHETRSRPDIRVVALVPIDANATVSVCFR